MTVGDAINILEQFPRDQVMEIGFATREDPTWITCLSIGDILLSEKHILIVDSETADLVKALIGARLNVRGKAKTKQDDEGISPECAQTEGEPEPIEDAPTGEDQQPGALNDNIESAG